MERSSRSGWITRRWTNVALWTCALATAVSFAPPTLHAQTSPANVPASTPQNITSATAVDLDQAPRVPGVATLLRGFNAGVTYSGVHNSVIGWYSVATPAISYSFSPHYSLDASASLYLHRYVQNINPGAGSGNRLIVDGADAGDTYLSFHATYFPKYFRSTTTASMTAPTGNQTAGLGVGRVTYDFSEHVEHYFGRLGALADIGGGDSSGLANNYVTKNYSSLGPLAHFQTGFVLWMPGRNFIESVAYEQLPIGSQTVSVDQPGSFGPIVTSATGLTEDNGFTTIVGIPLTDRITFSSYYNRSLRQHQDTVSVGITFVLRGTPRHHVLSIFDRALIEGERDVAPIAYPTTTSH